MAKKERLGSDPLKDGPLTWIQDTREEKKKEEIKPTDDAKTLKRQSVKTSKRFNAKELKRQNVKAPLKRKHTIYLSMEQSKKLRVYAAANEMPISEVIEKLINNNI